MSRTRLIGSEHYFDISSHCLLTYSLNSRFPGTATTEAQTNYFWLGVVDCKSTEKILPWYLAHTSTDTDNNGETITALSDTYSNYHDYTIGTPKLAFDGTLITDNSNLDWQPEELKFLIDGEVKRS